MKEKPGNYQLIDLPPARTGYLAYRLARAVDEYKLVQAYLKGRKQLVVFDDVDVGLTIERQVGGTRAPMGYIIRRANHKTFLEIHQEIRSVQTQPVSPNKGMAPWLRFAMLLPWPLPRLFGALLRAVMRRDPRIPAAQMGTVGLTAVGMFSRGRGSFSRLTPPMHPLMLIIGSIARKPAVVEDRIEPREILNVTIAFDHDVVDGAPAARFGRRLVELIVSGVGLTEIDQYRDTRSDPPEWNSRYGRAGQRPGVGAEGLEQSSETVM